MRAAFSLRECQPLFPSQVVSHLLHSLNSRATITRRASGLVEMDSSRAELAKEADSGGGHGQHASPPIPSDVWNF